MNYKHNYVSRAFKFKFVNRFHITITSTGDTYYAVIICICRSSLFCQINKSIIQWLSAVLTYISFKHM